MNDNRILSYTEAKKIDFETLEACSVSGGSSSSYMTAGYDYNGHSSVHVDVSVDF